MQQSTIKGCNHPMLKLHNPREQKQTQYNQSQTYIPSLPICDN
jgi:hypothetical protein